MGDLNWYEDNLNLLSEWALNVFQFTHDTLGLEPSEPIDELRGKPIKFTDAYGNQREVLLFDTDGRLVYNDLAFYTVDMFKNQTREQFKIYNGTRLTWQQTVSLTAYNRALATFNQDSYDIAKRWISIKSGHGCFALGTQVRMFDGSIKNVEDVVIGDKVMGDDNTPRTVLSLARGEEEMYRVSYPFGEYYDVNASHKLVLVATNSKGRRRTGDITEVAVKDYIKWSEEEKVNNSGFKRDWQTQKQENFNIKVEPLRVGSYYGFTLNGNHRFLLADGTVVRNTGKTATESIIALHFLICFFGSQIGMTANTEQQVQDIFLKEFSTWKRKLPPAIQNSIKQTNDHIRIEDSEDWFLRAQVARAEKPEALAGLHGKYVLIIVDEASGVHDKVFEVMKGALTGDYFIVIYCSNPTRNEGEFYESHKKGSRYTKLTFSSRQSPIVKEGFIEQMELDYPSIGGVPSDKVLIRVDGEFAGENTMDDKGWIPLFSNIRINFEPERGQIINRGIIALDPAGSGKDRSIAVIRDNVYLKEVLNEQTSEPKDLARKLETIRDAYNCTSNDIGIEAFGIGAQVVGEVTVKIGEHVTGILTDKPREGTEAEYNSYKMELAWKFRQWCANGGIIITNNPAGWLKEMEKIKYKRTRSGQMQLMTKVEFKKEFGFSPDRFDSAIHSFFKDEPSRPVHYTKQELSTQEMMDFIAKAQSTGNAGASKSSM